MRLESHTWDCENLGEAEPDEDDVRTSPLERFSVWNVPKLVVGPAKYGSCGVLLGLASHSGDGAQGTQAEGDLRMVGGANITLHFLKISALCVLDT